MMVTTIAMAITTTMGKSIMVEIEAIMATTVSRVWNETAAIKTIRAIVNHTDPALIENCIAQSHALVMNIM